MTPSSTFRNALLVTLLPCLPAASQGGQQGDSHARLILAKAMRALGGKDKVAGIATAQWKAKGMFYGYGQPLEFTGDFAVDGVDKRRAALSMKSAATKIDVATVLNGDKGWGKVGGLVVTWDPVTLKTYRGEAYLERLATLAPIARGAEQLKFAAAGSRTVGGRAAMAVEVSHGEYPPAVLLFDAATHLPVGAEWKARMGNGHSPYEIRMADYQSVDGVKHPTKIVITKYGKPYFDSTVSEYKAVTELDEKLFTKPE